MHGTLSVKVLKTTVTRMGEEVREREREKEKKTVCLILGRGKGGKETGNIGCKKCALVKSVGHGTTETQS